MPLPRSWNYCCPTFCKHAAPLVLPKLRAATPDSEKATPQNAAIATDQQIDLPGILSL
jgi:hypothetical protein